jgi:hypothetical protein
MIRLSASAVPRLLACPGSGHLRHADYQSKYADDGDDRHADAEAAADMRADDDLDPRVQALLEPGDELAAECSFLYDVSDDTCRALGHLNGRDYPARGPFEIPGTVDLLVRGARRILVIDYKGFEPVDPVASNAQIATYALMVARAGGYLEVTVAIVYLAAPWIPADVATLTVFDLDLHAEVLRAAVVSQDKSLRINKHCKYCPGFHDCAEQKRLAADAGGGALAMRVEAMVPFENDVEAADAYDLMKRIGILYGRIKAALTARAIERPIPLGNGRFFGPQAKQGNEKLDGDTVHAVVAELHDRDTADRAVIRSATKVRLEAALKGKRGAAKRVLDVVRERGGATRSAGTEICEYTAGPRLVTDDEPKQLTEAVSDSPF